MTLENNTARDATGLSVDSPDMSLPKGVAIRVQDLSKCYHLYDKPNDRLKQMIYRGRKQFFHEFWALKDVSFEVRKGEVLGIIGRNGSGKSTLLQMLCGTLNPTAGHIFTNGRIAALLELGSGFNPEFTGRENVYMNAAILGLSREEINQRYNDIVLFADIGDFIEQPVKTYSSGMVVRLAFAVASSVDPEILVVDEALAVGDSVFQAKCFRRFQQLREQGVTVILVTHDIGMIVQLCNRAMVLHHGMLVATGIPKVMGDEYRRRCAEETSTDRDMSLKSVSSTQDGYTVDNSDNWMIRSKNTQEYGGGRASIEGFVLLDCDGMPREKITSSDEIYLRMNIRFNEACVAPIAAFAFRDLAGQDLCGTNSWYENQEIGFVTAGASVIVEYKFQLPLQAGVYNLCLACTEIAAEGLVVHHRLYDVAVIEVSAERRFVGRFDLKPTTRVIYK